MSFYQKLWCSIFLGHLPYLACWVQFWADNIFKYFSYFSQKADYDISCIIRRECQSLFPGKNKINIINLLSAEFGQRAVQVKTVVTRHVFSINRNKWYKRLEIWIYYTEQMKLGIKLLSRYSWNNIKSQCLNTKITNHNCIRCHFDILFQRKWGLVFYESCLLGRQFTQNAILFSLKKKYNNLECHLLQFCFNSALCVNP